MPPRTAEFWHLRTLSKPAKEMTRPPHGLWRHRTVSLGWPQALIYNACLGKHKAARRIYCLFQPTSEVVPDLPCLEHLRTSPGNCRRRQRQRTPVLLPGKSHGRRSLVGCSPWGHEESDTYWATSLSLFTFMHRRRNWQPTPVFLPGESQGRRSLVGCHLCGRTESDTTEVT